MIQNRLNYAGMRILVLILTAILLSAPALTFANGSAPNTPVGQECLEGYSLLGEAVTYLGEEQDIIFYGLKNTSATSANKLWVRLELGPEAQEKLQREHPLDSGRQEAPANIRAVLCRVQAIPASGKCAVVEQIWLDDTNRIIGCKPAGEPQDAGWPANYIKKVCENFLEGWLTFGSMTAQTPKDTGSAETKGIEQWLWGINWGVDADKVKQIMKRQGFVLLDQGQRRPADTNDNSAGTPAQISIMFKALPANY